MRTQSHIIGDRRGSQRSASVEWPPALASSCRRRGDMPRFTPDPHMPRTTPVPWVRALLCAALILLCCASGAAAQSTSAATGQLFAPSSFWNARLADRAPLDQLSGAYVGDLRRQLRTWKPWINTNEYSTPYYVVGPDTLRTRVTLDKPLGVDTDLAAAWASVPMPLNARPAGGTDSQLVVYQPATDTMWEFWQLSRQ